MNLSGHHPASSCYWHEPLWVDEDGYALCALCGLSYRALPSLREDLLSAADHILREAGYMTLTERSLERELEDPPSSG